MELVGRGAECQVNGVMFTEGKQHISYHTLQHHAAPDCRSDFLYKAALQDQSRTVWRGMIKVDPQARRRPTAISGTTTCCSRPMPGPTRFPAWKFNADDVRCTHGSTSGKVDEELIFYAQLPRPDSQRSDAHDRQRLFPADLRPHHDRKRPRNAPATPYCGGFESILESHSL